MFMNETTQTDRNYSYALHLYKQDGSPLGQASVEIDWEPALEWCHLQGIRKGKLPPMFNIGHHTIEPIWDAEVGKPFLSSFRTVISADDGSEGFSVEFPITYFASPALKASEDYLNTGQLKPGDLLRYRMAASSGRPAFQAEASRAQSFSVREVPKPIPLGAKSLRRLRIESVPFEGEEDEDLPVFISNHVLEEACSRTRQGGAHEVGGILLGHLHRDTDSSEVIAEVTAEVPVLSAQSKLYSLSITGESWAAVRKAIDLRNNGEMMLGWWHSHSFMKELCQNCERLEDKSCDHTAVYMSEKDCGLHRAAFYRAYNLALVLGDTPCTGLRYGLYGWSRGGIHRRGFRILHAGPTEVRTTKALPAKGTEGEKNVG
jgi:hypothetical protein